MTTIPVALTIAGSDSGGGAGIQADLKTFEAHGVFGTSALTLVTAQNTLGVQAVHLLPAQLVQEQIHAVLTDFPVGAIKIGALGNAELIQAVCEVLEPALRENPRPLVIDPVMLAKSGDALLDAAATHVLVQKLFPLATLITPNVPEWQILQQQCTSVEWPLLLKGGHADETAETVRDELRTPQTQLVLEASRQHTKHTHGTGCTLSAAITAQLAKNMPLAEAVKRGHAYVQQAIRHAPKLGAGHGPLQFGQLASQF